MFANYYEHLLAVSFLGAIVGYVSGLFGVGGGFMLTPLLHAIFGVPITIAVGSGLAQMIGIAVIASYRHTAAGYVDKKLAMLIAPGILIGSVSGQSLLERLKCFGEVTIAGHQMAFIDLSINSIFVVLLLWIAYRLWRDPKLPAEDNTAGKLCWIRGPWQVATPNSGIAHCSYLALLACGVLLGIMAGLLGIGGGVMVIPLLMYGFGVPLRMAIGTSSLLILISAVSGTIMHAFAGNIDLRLVIVLLVGSIVGVQVGVFHSHRLHITHLRRAFVFIVLIIAGIVIFRFFA